jgi:hypothetical protein
MNNVTGIGANGTQPSSGARTDANRRNAALSTGPRTESGKARSAQNAVRSGWFSQRLQVAEGAGQLYLEFEQAWVRELAPEGLLELEAFNDFLRASWHKREVIEAQSQLAPSSPAAFLDEALARRLDRLHRYERDFERRANRALRELRRLRSVREPAAPAARTLAEDLRAGLSDLPALPGGHQPDNRANKAPTPAGQDRSPAGATSRIFAPLAFAHSLALP